jgi:hypothetical protein
MCAAIEVPHLACIRVSVRHSRAVCLLVSTFSKEIPQAEYLELKDNLQMLLAFILAMESCINSTTALGNDVLF